MPTLTIFTATYNRAHLISRIYTHLLSQSNFDFEWLVIDDGSTDDTEFLFKKFLSNNNPFTIRYYKQNNQGLIRTLNKGIKLSKGKYFTKLDSDDYPLEYFAKTLLAWIKDIQDIPNIYAVGGLRITPDGIPLKGVWPNINNYVDATDLERSKYNIDSDMTESWSLEILKKYPFPVWENEKFAPEQIVLHQIALDGYLIRWYPVPLTICEYQNDGLTKGASKLEKENPMGYAMMFNHMLKRKDLKFIQKLRIAMNHIALSIVGKNPQYIFQSNDILYTIISIFPGLLLAIRRKYQHFKIHL